MISRNVFNLSDRSITDFLTLKTVTECGLETSCLTNKLGELSLATFDENGVCVSQTGSWAFSQ